MTVVPRLIDFFIPNHYDLSLKLEREARTFSGTVSITGSSVDQTTDIVLHSKDLNIISVLVDGKKAAYAIEEHDQLRITHDDITPGEHIVVISFSGDITDAMHGMYPCYFEVNGEKKELLATQFESHHAREVFPSVDEPEAKATFDVTLTTEGDIIVLGNMPIQWQRTESGNLVTKFQKTPRMSTYLLAWVTGELQRKTATTSSGVEVNIWATEAHSSQSLDFALDIATRTIDFYDEYFDTPYPLPKSDHVALPDFSSGAMENWGLITYREVALLADPKTTSISSRQYIATVIAHELAHQWFGNLVTMRWWNNLWLNESFATLMEYIAVDTLHPEWNSWLDFATSESIMALRRDAVDGVQSVQVDVNHPDEISTLFDGAIVYAKGARLLRMLEQFVGEANFRSGLQQYFKDHAYDNTEADDLWNAIGKASGKNIAEMMNTWISQPGFPVVHASKDDNNRITLRQEQFFIGKGNERGTIWPVPLNSSCGEMPELLETSEQTIDRHHTSALMFNIGDSAHFITHYDNELQAMIIEQLKSGQLPEITRIQLLNEATLLARSGIISTSDLIPLIESYTDETSEHVWSIISLALIELRKFVENDETAEEKLKQLSADIARSQYQRLGWMETDSDSDEDRKLRATVISLMLYAEDKEAIDKAEDLFVNNKLEDLDPELRSLIISSAVRHGDSKRVYELLDVYRQTTSAELSQDISLGLTSTRDVSAIKSLLEAIKDSNTVRLQDVFRWFAYLARGRYSRDEAWNWLTENWDWVTTTFEGDKSYDDFPRYAAQGPINRDGLDRYEKFFSGMKDIPALSRVINIGIAEIEARVELIERDQANVISALNSR